MRHVVFFCIIAAIGISLLVVVAKPPPSVSFSLVGFETNVIAGSEINLPRNTEYICAIIRMTNAGPRTVSYHADMDTPGYSTFNLEPKGWTESRYVFRCGLVHRVRTLAPRETVTFTAIIESDKPCKIGVSYDDASRKIHFPDWLVQRLPWLRHESLAMTSVIRFDATK